MVVHVAADSAEGVATLAARVNAIEAWMASQNDITNEALETIAEIATRTYTNLH